MSDCILLSICGKCEPKFELNCLGLLNYRLTRFAKASRMNRKRIMRQKLKYFRQLKPNTHRPSQPKNQPTVTYCDSQILIYTVQSRRSLRKTCNSTIIFILAGVHFRLVKHFSRATFACEWRLSQLISERGSGSPFVLHKLCFGCFFCQWQDLAFTLIGRCAKAIAKFHGQREIMI